jgi:hypothetical protein
MPPEDLRERLATVGRNLALREGEHRAGLDDAWKRAEELHQRVSAGLVGYHEAIAKEGAAQLEVELGRVHTDEKHVRSVEFSLARGRHRALFVVKSKGEVIMVGPFRTGKKEGPCQPIEWRTQEELDAAILPFLESFLEQAATP